ncbi:hypothetical protein Pfo_027570 [Paulownia fortunei]|nr:hypothetical protein Pfo_027570 [Paulownia fortunei]
MLKEVAEDSYVYKHVSLDEFPMDPWHHMNETATHFMNRCMASENPEALYRLGMVEYFGWDNLDRALECLNKSASLGHVGAYYIISIILLSNGDDFIQNGVTILSAMKRSREYRDNVKFYRKNLIELLRSIWKRNPTVLNRPPTCCTMNHRFVRRNAWALVENDEEDNVFCDACICDREITYIIEVLPSL